MKNVPSVTFLPAGKTVKVKSVQTLIQLSRTARVIIPQLCGGHASCQMCKVQVLEGSVTSPTPLEARKVAESEISQGFRLACQTKVLDGHCVVRIPESRLKSVVAAALQRQREMKEH